MSQKILSQLREFGVTPVKLESNGLNSQQLETNEIDIKSEDSYNINEDNSDTCNENNKYKIDSVFSYVNIKPFNNEDNFIEKTENKNNLDASKKQNINLDSTNTNIGKNSLLSCDLDEQPINKRLKLENSESTPDDNNCEVSNKGSDEIVKFRKNKGKKSTKGSKKSKSNQKDKKKLEVIKNDDTIQNGLPCPQCKKCFELDVDLEIHMLKHQKYNDNTCPKCSRTFENEKNLKQHFNTHMINKPYKCNVCDRSFAGSCDRNRHILRIHTGNWMYFKQNVSKKKSNNFDFFKFR